MLRFRDSFLVSCDVCCSYYKNAAQFIGLQKLELVFSSTSGQFIIKFKKCEAFKNKKKLFFLSEFLPTAVDFRTG